MEMVELRSRKKMNLPEAELRTFCVSCRLNPVELSILDEFRGKRQRGEALRMMALQNLPAPPPAINIVAWCELSKASANLNQTAHKLNAGESLQINEIRAELEAFRAALIGAAL